MRDGFGRPVFDSGRGVLHRLLQVVGDLARDVLGALDERLRLVFRLRRRVALRAGGGNQRRQHETRPEGDQTHGEGVALDLLGRVVRGVAGEIGCRRARVVGDTHHAVPHAAHGGVHLALLPLHDLGGGHLVGQGVHVGPQLGPRALDVGADGFR